MAVRPGSQTTGELDDLDNLRRDLPHSHSTPEIHNRQTCSAREDVGSAIISAYTRLGAEHQSRGFEYCGLGPAAAIAGQRPQTADPGNQNGMPSKQ